MSRFNSIILWFYLLVLALFCLCCGFFLNFDVLCFSVGQREIIQSENSLRHRSRSHVLQTRRNPQLHDKEDALDNCQIYSTAVKLSSFLDNRRTVNQLESENNLSKLRSKANLLIAIFDKCQEPVKID